MTTMTKMEKWGIDKFLAALNTTRFFAERQGKADFVQFRSILLRKGGLPPREGDTIGKGGGQCR
jgi:hypothetical protein